MRRRRSAKHKSGFGAVLFCLVIKQAGEARYSAKRTEGKELGTLSEITGGERYDRLEATYDVGGRCIDPYAFKDYGGSWYELMSMGAETLYHDPSRFRKDPRILKWVLEMLERRGV